MHLQSHYKNYAAGEKLQTLQLYQEGIMRYCVLIAALLSTGVMADSQVDILVEAAQTAQKDPEYLLDYTNAKKSKTIIHEIQEALDLATKTKTTTTTETKHLQNAITTLARLLVSKVLVWNTYQQIFNDSNNTIEITIDNRPFIEIQKELERQIGTWIGERVSLSIAQTTQAGKIASGALGTLKQIGQKLNLAKNQIIEGLALPKEYGSPIHKSNVATYFKAIELYAPAQDNPKVIEKVNEIFEDELTPHSNHHLKKITGSLQNYLESRAEELKKEQAATRESKKEELLVEAEALISTYKGGYEDIEKRDAVLEKMRMIKEELSNEQFIQDKRMQKRIELLQNGIDTIRYLFGRMMGYCKGSLVAPAKNKVLGLLTSDTVFDLLKPKNSKECSAEHKKLLTGYLNALYHYIVVLAPMSEDDPSHVRDSIESMIFDYINNQKNLTDTDKIIREIKSIMPEFKR